MMSIGFPEAVIYGKFIFGKDFDHCEESGDGGWLGFFIKSDPGVAYEDQTWDEFEYTFKHMLDHDKKFKDYYQKNISKLRAKWQ